MSRFCSLRWTFATAAMLACSSFDQGQPIAPLGDEPLADEPTLKDIGHWDFDEVRVQNGREYRGLIESESSSRLTFIEVIRPPGRAMSLIVHPLSPAAVVHRKQLDADRRRQLNSRIENYKRRAAIEAGQMDAVVLSALPGRTPITWRFDGPWFALESTADERTTRRVIVRIEQVFMAYERVLPSRRTPDRRLRVLLFGALDEYKRHLEDLALKIDHPAFYWAEGNVIAAGGDLTKFGRQLAKAQADIDQARRELDAEAARVPAELDRRSRELESQGYSKDQRRELLVAERKRWEAELARRRQQVVSANRRNLSALDAYTDQMFRRLYHEAFHAYLENYVYPASNSERRVPRWLNEGLAQVYETGLLEADTLRVDAADPTKLARLQADLKGKSPLPLADLLTADERVFVVPHGQSRDDASRHYLYSWGLAYYLTFGPTPLTAAGVDVLSQRDQNAADRLERLTGTPVLQFEHRWRTEMLRIAPSRPTLAKP